MLTRSKSKRDGSDNPDRNRPHTGLILIDDNHGNKNGQENTDVAPIADGLGIRTEATLCGPHNETEANPSDKRNLTKRQPWTKIEQKELIWCYLYCKESSGDNYLQVYKLWRERNPNSRPNFDANKLQNQRRYIMQNNKLTQQDIENIKANLKNTFKIAEEDPIETPAQQENIAVEDMAELETEKEQLISCIRAKLEVVETMDFEDRYKLKKIPENKECKALLKLANDIVSDLIVNRDTCELQHINNIVYAIACVITEKMSPNNNTRHMTTKKSSKLSTPPWQRRLELKIVDLRKNLPTLMEIQKGNIKNNIIKARILKRHNIKSDIELSEKIEEIKQKVLATSQRLRRYKKRQKQWKDNTDFARDNKMFYRKLGQNDTRPIETPIKEELETYWRNIYENDIGHNGNASWLREFNEAQRISMTWTDVTAQDVTLAIKKTVSWKAAGIDQITNYWLKKLPSLHEIFARIFNKMIEDDTNIPSWLARGRTYLISKGGDTKNPKNYRPITCLNTIYKILTRIIANKISAFIGEHKLLPVEQKGCAKDSMGCKDLLLYSKAALQDCKKKLKNMNIAWIDYRKAFDSVPHSWILQSMELIGVSINIISFIEVLMQTWCIKMYLKTQNNNIETNTIGIKCGIYQGDSLSPLLFCIALAPLSKLLNQRAVGYKITGVQDNISHLLYMDDLKLICSSKAQLQKQLNTVQQFSTDICMQFGLDKCATASFIKGKLHWTENIKTHEGSELKSLDYGQVYKYLGIDEGENIKHDSIKENLTKEYRSRLRKILQTELHARNKIAAIGALAVPLVSYSFGIVNWRLEELRQLDRKTRKMLTMYGLHHPRSDSDRLYVQRKKGGRGLISIEDAHEKSIYNMGTFIRAHRETDRIIRAVYKHDQSLTIHKSLTKRSEKTIKRLFPRAQENQETHNYTPTQVKSRLKEQRISGWKEKIMHGQLARTMDALPIDEERSICWLKYGNIKGETESLIIAAQEQALNTRYHEFKILKTRADGKCRLCKTFMETPDHLMSGCPVLAKKEYIERHNRVCSLIHYDLCRHYKVPLATTLWYQHKPESVMVSEDGKTTILYDQQINTDRHIPANKPDIVIREEKICYIIEVSIPSDNNIVSKESEKLLKYKDLTIELKRMWKKKVEIIPVIIGSTGYVGKGSEEILRKLPGEHKFYLLQRTAILGTAHILRKILT